MLRVVALDFYQNLVELGCVEPPLRQCLPQLGDLTCGATQFSPSAQCKSRNGGYGDSLPASPPQIPFVCIFGAHLQLLEIHFRGLEAEVENKCFYFINNNYQ